MPSTTGRPEERDRRDWPDPYRKIAGSRHDRDDRYGQATLLVQLGDTHDAAGDRGAARTAWHRALAILDALAHPEAEGILTKLAS
jgi:hypothetical protein